MNVLGDLLARERRSDAPALRAPAIGREYDYRRFCTTAWKVGNFFRHFGVRGGSTVALSADPWPKPILAFLGTALLGGIARFDPPRDTDARALVLPASESSKTEYDLPPGSQRIVYNNPPDDPSVAYFEQGVWSENPTKPPDIVESEQPVLRGEDGTTYTHEELLDAARSVVDAWELTATDRVAVRASLREPGTIVAGVVAPLLAGGTILLPDGERGDCAVGNDAPETRVLSPDAIELE